MDTEKRVQILELAYAGALVDSVRWLKNWGVLEKVTEQKKKACELQGSQVLSKFQYQSDSYFFKLRNLR